ncbi:GSU2403 family nucleotidyltransferase fold protein [Chitinimonas koreensis]|uniref:GSU2403 family nucleotidyltransferase fold protein n=1 Tax=Chitinimonas koreensis TaxID=356302 RepID=UPI00048B53BE|nr:GSU2403 family nucleotidyltransferase fold protein [Chitinimonas koreensis]QNM95502.1 hypothetical protein H9L41_16750 [Chitinimonas koreensis]
MFQDFTDEQRRLLANLDQFYDALITAEREMRAISLYPLHWKTVSGRDYLYQIIDSRGNAKSLGARDAETEQRHQAWHGARDRRDGAKQRLVELGRQYGALRLGQISSSAAAILRESDARGMLGTLLIVVGTNAMPAYEIEAQSRIGRGLDATEDFDVAWVAGLHLSTKAALPQSGSPIWEMLRAVDSTYTVNTERGFQVRNANAYEVELLVAPSQADSLVVGDKPVPISLPEQEWLLNGRFVDRVVCGRDGSPARIVAPDPRWFALHKLWMAEQPKRNVLKRTKDHAQGLRVLDAVFARMPHYPLDEAFAAELPDELVPYLSRWRAETQATPPAAAW